MAPGHDRPRCVYVDFLNTGPALSKTLRAVVNRTTGIRKAGDLCIIDLVVADGEVTGAVALHLGSGAAVVIAAKATIIAAGGLTKLYKRNPEHLANRVEVAGLFWHFVDLVWIFVFPLFYLL